MTERHHHFHKDGTTPKIRYASLRDAERAAWYMRGGGTSFSAYRCSYRPCRSWHVGSDHPPHTIRGAEWWCEFGDREIKNLISENRGSPGERGSVLRRRARRSGPGASAAAEKIFGEAS